MLKGRCLCGGVRYEYTGTIDEISMCHCAQCRQAQGSAFVAVAPIERSKFKLTQGSELLKSFRSNPIKQRVFCGECGSALYSARDDLPAVIRLRLGSVETPFECANSYHIFVDDKASWYALTDDLPKYPGFKP